MGLANVLLLSQLAGNIAVLILSLCIIIPMSIHVDDFRGRCLLFSSGEWEETDGQFKVAWASQGFCSYTIFVGVLLFVLSSAQIYRLSLLLYKGQDSSFLSAFFDVVIAALLSLLAAIAALIVTLGFGVWCKAITLRFETCGDAQNNEIDKNDKIDTASFYIQMGTAQFGAWASWACCVGLLVFATLKLWRYHQEENMRVSMAVARDRLVKNSRRGLVPDDEMVSEDTDTDTVSGPAGDFPASSTTNNTKRSNANGKKKSDPGIHSI